MAFCYCTSPKTLVQIQAVGHERKKKVVFIFEDAIVRVYEDYLGVHADDLGKQISASTVDIGLYRQKYEKY